MSLRVCLDCTTAFAVGVPRCPHCGSERHAAQHEAEALGIQHGVPVEISEEENSMPKITRHGGASVASEEPDQGTAQVAGEAEGGEDVSAGEDSSTSSETPSKKPEQSGKQTRSRARKTASPSVEEQTGSSSAPSTDGGQTADTSAADK